MLDPPAPTRSASIAKASAGGVTVVGALVVTITSQTLLATWVLPAGHVALAVAAPANAATAVMLPIAAAAEARWGYVTACLLEVYRLRVLIDRARAISLEGVAGTTRRRTPRDES